MMHEHMIASARSAGRPLAVLLAVGAFVIGLASGPAFASNLLALVDTGEVFSSADGGMTWSGLATITVYDAVDIFAGNASSELYIGTRTGGIYRSTDAGSTWSAQGTIAASDVVAVNVRVNGEIYALTETGAVYRSTDDAVTFAGVGTITSSDLVSLVEQKTTRDLYALAETGGVWRSTDDGVTWIAVGVVLSPDAREIEAVGGDLFVMTSTGAIAQSTNNGLTWTFVGTLSQVHMRAMTVDDGTTLVAASEEGHVATSANGVGWTWQGSVNQLTVVAIGTDEPTPSAVDDGPTVVPSLSLRTVFPNPVGGGGQAFVFSFDVAASDRVSLEVFDALGRRVTRTPGAAFDAGSSNSLRWSPVGLASGVYFARLVGEASGATAPRKLVIVR